MAFDRLGDLIINGVYRIPIMTRGSGYALEVSYPDEYPIKCIVTTFSNKEAIASFGKINIMDRKILLPRKDLTFEASTAGEIVAGETVYTIVGVQTDPAESIYTIQAREK